MKTAVCFFIPLILIGCRERDFLDSHALDSSSKLYLNIQEMIDYVPEMVGPGVISTQNFEGHGTVSPDGKEIYFAIYSNDHRYSTIAHSLRDGQTWSKPQITEFSGKYSDGSPAFSPDGKKLFFSSTRATNGSPARSDNDIWYVERTPHGWGAPLRLGTHINTEFREFSPSVDSEGNLYFCSNKPNGFGDLDVYESAFVNGTYQAPLNLGSAINTEYREGNVGISPDGNLLFIMVQHKPGDYGFDDIHYSLKRGDTWSKAKNVGEIINTNTYDFSPKVSADGSLLYFTSRINREYVLSNHQSYTYDEYQNHLNSPLNGFGNIYRIAISELNLE